MLIPKPKQAPNRTQGLKVYEERYGKEVIDFIKQMFSDGYDIKTVRSAIVDEFDIDVDRRVYWDMKNRSSVSVDRKEPLTENRFKNKDMNITGLEIEELNKEFEDDIEYDNENFYVYSSKYSNGDKQKIRFAIPFWLVNKLQFAYVISGENRSGQEIVNTNWGTEEDPIYIDEKAWIAFRSQANLQKNSGICNKIYLRVLEDKFGEEAKEEFIEQTAIKSVTDGYRKKELDSIERARETQLNKIFRQHNRIEDYLYSLSESINAIPEPEGIDIINRDVGTEEYFGFGDIHAGKNRQQIEASLSLLASDIRNSSAEHIVLFNVGDNMETTIIDGMHSTQNLDLKTRGFDQILECVDIFQNFFYSLLGCGKTIKMYGITGNHGRGSKSREEDMERLPELAMYEILKSRLRERKNLDIYYYKEYVPSIFTEHFNFILLHGDYHLKMSAENILNAKDIDPRKHTVILQGHIHTQGISEGRGYTRITTASMNHGGWYEDNIILKESRPGYVRISESNGYPQVEFRKL